MGDFRKKYPQTDFVGKKLAKICLGKMIFSTEKKKSPITYIILKKKSYTVICQGINF